MFSCCPGSLHFAHACPSTAPTGPMAFPCSWALPAVRSVAQGPAAQLEHGAALLLPVAPPQAQDLCSDRSERGCAPAQGWALSSTFPAGRAEAQLGWASEALSLPSGQLAQAGWCWRGRWTGTGPAWSGLHGWKSLGLPPGHIPHIWAREKWGPLRGVFSQRGQSGPVPHPCPF